MYYSPPSPYPPGYDRFPPPPSPYPPGCGRPPPPIPPGQRPAPFILAAAGAALVLIVVIVCYWRRRRRQSHPKVRDDASQPSVGTLRGAARQRTVRVWRPAGEKFGLDFADDESGGGVVISKVYSGFACDVAGVCEAERLVAVNGVDTRGMSIAEVLALMMRQPEGAVHMRLAQPDARTSSQPPQPPPPQPAMHDSGPESVSRRWRIDPSRLEVTGEVLGRGATGVVRLGYLDGSMPVAVKLLPPASSAVNANVEKELQTLALTTVHCAQACRLIGTCAVAPPGAGVGGGTDAVALVMKKYECSLHDLLCKEQVMEPRVAMGVGARIAKAIDELHDLKVIKSSAKPPQPAAPFASHCTCPTFPYLTSWHMPSFSPHSLTTRWHATLADHPA